MNILKEVLKHQVYPAMGCTEPVSVALCSAHASRALGERAQSIQCILDAGTYKNGMGVTLPNTGGRKGNLLAAAIGALIAEPGLKMEIFKAATPAVVRRASAMVARRKVKMRVFRKRSGIYVEVRLRGRLHRSACVIAGSHTDLVFSSKDGKTLVSCGVRRTKEALFKEELRNLSIRDMVRFAQRMDEEDLRSIRRGVEMNLSAARAGMRIRKVGYYLQDLLKKGYLLNDVFSSSKIRTACATDARMDGCPVPVMSSGESGNQGIIANLVPYTVGEAFKIPRERIYRSIGLSHLLNAYVKLFTGGLSPICGCAIAAGVGAAAAIVYQRKGADVRGISLAVNNVISDLGGMLCDGAKSGCALKVVSSTDCAIRSAYMGIHHYGITEREGFVGKSAEETIRNLAMISTVGMKKVDRTIVNIMLDKQGRLARSCDA